MTEVLVYVSVGGTDVLAGKLFSHRRRNVESATFSYAPEYLRNSDAYALDPGLPLAAGSYQTPTNRALFGAFTDCAPDRWGRTLVKRRETAQARVQGRAARSIGELDFLLGVRDDLRQGALRFTLDGATFLADDATGVPALTDLPALLDLAARAERDTADLPDLQRLIRVGSSLGGARPKAHVLHVNGRVAIAKFPSTNSDSWNVMAWEKVALDLAHAAGIEVPTSCLLDLAGRSVLVVDRFDRTESGERICYASAMTMLEASDGEQRSYLELAEVIETTSDQTTAELHQLWRRIVFSVLISNTDDHLRNHGFLHHRGDVWRLAPAFDLNPNPEPGAKFLSTSIDGGDDAASVGTALAVAEYFGLTGDQARHILAEVAAAVGQWRSVAAGHQLCAAEIRAMEPAFVALHETAEGAAGAVARRVRRRRVPAGRGRGPAVGGQRS